MTLNEDINDDENEDDKDDGAEQSKDWWVPLDPSSLDRSERRIGLG